MQQKSDDFSVQEALRLANTPAGQQLLTLLRQADSTAVSKAMAQGDYSQIKKLLAPLLATEEAQALLTQLGGNRNG